MMHGIRSIEYKLYFLSLNYRVCDNLIYYGSTILYLNYYNTILNLIDKILIL